MLVAGYIAALSCIEFSLLSSTPARAAEPADPTPMEQLRAAYLFTFAKLVAWPSSVDASASPFTFCFSGGRGVREALVSGTAGRRIGTHPILTRNIGVLASKAGCRVWYVDQFSSAGDRSSSRPDTAGVLTVGDTPLFTRDGGMIALFEDHHNLRFTVNLDNARSAGLTVSAELSSVASNLKSTPQ
jgi:hypothetical protein